MSYTRLVNRRGTAAQWTSSNPILATGEFGFESDTGKFKIGNGSSNWAALEYFVNATALKGEIIDGSPTALDTLNELAEALNDDENFATTVTELIGEKAPLESPAFTGTVDFSDATVSGIILPINWTGTYQTATTYVENDLVEYQGSVYYATGPDINGTFVPGSGDWELFASKGDTGATGATGPVGPTGAIGGFSSTQTIELGTTRALTASDAGKLITNSAAITITVEGLSVGQQVDFLQTATSQITFTPGSGITLNSKGNNRKTAVRYSPASVKCVALNSYVLVGDLAA